MDRTFRKRFTLGAKCGIAIFGMAAVYFFWNMAVLPAVALMLVEVIAIERVVHSCYVLSGRGVDIYKGRFGRTKHIGFNEIKSVKCLKPSLWSSVIVVIECQNGKLVLLQPESLQNFMRELKKRMK